MTRNERGFTLIELMIVIAIIAIIAAIAIPNLLAARLSANETAAIATLRNIVSAQAQFQQGSRCDTDDDGVGEYGGFVELSGKAAGRMAAILVPPVLSAAFQNLNAGGQVTRSGYYYQIFLPDVAGGGVAVAEPQLGFTAAIVDPDLCETTWCAYAWPVNYQQSGNRVFFTNQAGDVLTNEDSAIESVDPANMVAGGYGAFALPNDITSGVAIGTAGQTGGTEVWRQVN